MTGYDGKRIELSHDAAEEVTFTIEVDFDHAGFRTYERVAVPADKEITHRFPDGFSAHWVRLRSSRNCAATARFVYD